MSVFLTQNSPGLRTSPVKRGYWVVRRVLGETIPPPPLTFRNCPATRRNWICRCATCWPSTARTRACASCHARFDSFGLAFEGYGPIGERRSKDLARTAGGYTRRRFPAAARASGFEGVQRFIREHRQKDFIDNLSRKLLAYSLGARSCCPTSPLIESMSAKLGRKRLSLRSLVETIVTSPQFLNKRRPDPPETAKKQER